MKKGIFYVLAIIAIVSLSSCYSSSVTAEQLQKGYNNYKEQINKKNNQKSLFSRITKTEKKQNTLFDDVKVFYNEYELDGEYETVAICTYHPVVVPILGSVKRSVKRKYIYRAMQMCKKRHGDAILINDLSTYRVLKRK